MRHGPLSRRTRLKSDPEKRRAFLNGRKPLQCRTRLRLFNPTRRARRRKAGLVYGPYHEHMSTLPCILAGVRDHECIGPVAGHHVKTVGSGGKDFANEIPCCSLSHLSAHTLGSRLFAIRWGVCMRSRAQELGRRWAGA